MLFTTHQALCQAPYEHYLIYSFQEPYQMHIIHPILQMRNTGFMRLNHFLKVSDAKW